MRPTTWVGGVAIVLAGCAGRPHQYVPVDSSNPEGQTASADTTGPRAGPRTPTATMSATAAHEMQPGIYFVTVDGKRRTSRVEAVFEWHRLAADACGGRDRYEVLAYPVGGTPNSPETVDPNLLEGYVRCRLVGGNSMPAATPTEPEPAPEPPMTEEPEVRADPEPSEPAPEPAVAPTPAPAPTPASPPPPG